MAFDPAFLELMSQTCTLKPPTAANLYNEKTFGTPVTPRCHIKYKAKHIYSEGAVIKVEDGFAILDGVYGVGTDWFMSVPPATGGAEVQVKVTSVDQYADEDGPHHTTVHFGSF